MRYPHLSSILYGFIGCIVYFGFSFSNRINAQSVDARIYAAKKDGLWGLIDGNGDFVLSPRYIQAAYQAGMNAYFMVDSGSIADRFNLDVYDTLGKLHDQHPNALTS